MIKLGLIFFSCLCLNVAAFATTEATTAETETTEMTAATVTKPGVEKTVEKSEATVLTVAKAEDQIPLTIDQVKKASDSEPMSTRLMMTGLIITALLGTAYYFVKKYKFSNTINKSNMQIKVLSQHYLGPKKSLAIIRVAGESILVGVTDTNISMIKSLSLLDDEIPSEMPQNFAEAMTTENSKTASGAMAVASKTPASTTKISSQATTMNSMTAEELEEEFSFSGLKDTVSKKLKSMRSI